MAAEKKSINDILGISIDKIKEIVDIKSVVGDPIITSNGTNIIPIAKVSYGFASGGSDLPSKYDKELCGGGSGAGVSIKLDGFLLISKDGNAKMVTIESSKDPINNLISSLPTIIEKIQILFSKKNFNYEKDKNSESDR